MSTSLLYHAFGIRGYEYTRTDYQDGHTIFTIHQDPKTCGYSACGSPQVESRGQVQRRFRAVPIGSRTTFVVLPVPRVEDVMITSGPMEGTNNKIKTMKRQAYGFRDHEFFKLKILAIHESRYELVG
jgi:hypothetical protein